MPVFFGRATGPAIPSGSDIIDAMRAAVRRSRTTRRNLARRVRELHLWLGMLQQRGADTRPLFDVDRSYHRLQREVAALPDGRRRRQRVREQCRTVDRAFGELEAIQAAFAKSGPVATPREADPGLPAPPGDLSVDWPTFQADRHNTGSTAAPGPRTGREAWRVPVGLGWYSRPVVEDGRVYAAAPGMRTIAYCFDLSTGRTRWRAEQEHPLFGIYKYPAIASSPVVLDKEIVLREVNSHGGNAGQARHLVFLSKSSGRILRRTVAGHIDYRTQNAPVASDGRYAVYPFGVHDIYGRPAVCQNLNRLVCADYHTGTIRWDVNIGDIDALAEPVIAGDLVFCATMEGYVYALRLDQAGATAPVAWSFQADGPVNSMVEHHDGRIYFGSNAGTVHCLEAASGQVVWTRTITRAQPNARKAFSTPLVREGLLYVGSTNRSLYCLDAADGSARWSVPLGDWIRARPVAAGTRVVAATLDGRLHGIEPDGRLAWSIEVGAHPVYADLAGDGERVVLTDSSLDLSCFDADGRRIWRRNLLGAFTSPEGTMVFEDQLSGGTYYQSKPTAYRGLVYYGTPSGFLVAVDATTGREVWRFEMGAAISVGPACAEGRVFAGQQGGERFFYALDAATGSLAWKQTLPGGWVWGSAKVDEGRVYVPTVSGYAVCLDAGTGHILWMYPTAASVPAEPAIDDDHVYFGSWSGSLYAFDKKTGDVAWKKADVHLDSGTLIARDGRVYTPNHADIFSCFDAASGRLLCPGNRDSTAKGELCDFNASPAFHGDRAFFSARGGVGLLGVPLFSTVYCVDSRTADILWKHADGGGLSAPAVAGGRVYIASGNTPLLYCLDEETGEEVWVFRLGHRVEESTLCVYRDRLYVLCADGWLHCIA